MKPKTIDSLHKELIKKQSILSSLQNGVRIDKLQDADDFDIEESWFNKERFSMHYKQELKQIETALQKIEVGTFGVCQMCDDEIPVKRLRVRPDATYCLACQEVIEREMGHHARVPGNNIAQSRNGSNLH